MKKTGRRVSEKHEHDGESGNGVKASNGWKIFLFKWRAVQSNGDCGSNGCEFRRSLRYCTANGRASTYIRI